MFFDVEVFIAGEWHAWFRAGNAGEAYEVAERLTGEGSVVRVSRVSTGWVTSETLASVGDVCEACGGSPAPWEVHFLTGKDQMWCYDCLVSRTDWSDSTLISL